MSNINERIKRLDIYPARLPTQSEIEAGDSMAGRNSLGKINLLVGPARDIKKIPVYLRLPSVGLHNINSVQQLDTSRRLVYQWNLTFGSHFVIDRWTNLLNNNNLQYCGLCIKWRVGTDVFRYDLSPVPPTVIFPSVLPRFNVFDYYAYQVIPSNFCIELWGYPPFPFIAQQFGTLGDIIIPTYERVLPNDGDETIRYITAGDAYNIAQLGNAVPETLPDQQDNLAFLSN